MDEPTFVDEGVGVILEEQVVERPALGHEPEQVVVAAEEDVQAQLHAVACQNIAKTKQAYTQAGSCMLG